MPTSTPSRLRIESSISCDNSFNTAKLGHFHLKLLSRLFQLANLGFDHPACDLQFQTIVSEPTSLRGRHRLPLFLPKVFIFLTYLLEKAILGDSDRVERFPLFPLLQHDLVIFEQSPDIMKQQRKMCQIGAIEMLLRRVVDEAYESNKALGPQRNFAASHELLQLSKWSV